MVTDSEETAKILIGHLKKNRYGRATFLPLTAVSSRGGFPEPQALKEPGAIGAAADLVKTRDEYKGLIQYLLGRVLVVDHMDHAIAIARKMEEAGLCTAEEFLEEANTGDFSEYTFWQYVPDDADAPDRFMKCEGYLFPDTYEFLTDDTVHHYVATFYAHFDKQFTDEMYRELEKQELTLPEVITLASFVQEEAGNDQDSNVAQVFRNRLAEESPYPKLQSNTSSYVQSDEDNNYLWNWVAPYYGGWEDIPENIRNAYDTYTCTGLPAGPISNPGLAAIQAALAPQCDEEVRDCYFFVTDLSGHYYYAKTYAEHQANCRKAAEVNQSLKK